MKRKRNLLIGSSFIALIVACGVGQSVVEEAAEEQAAVGGGSLAPMFEVDPFWPKPLPNNWRLGSSIGVHVDDQDHVWMVHRSSATLGNNERALELDPPQGECCAGAPQILSFDQEGNLVQAWGGPSEVAEGEEGYYEWPASNHGIFVDHIGYVWIGGNGQQDSHVLKFTKDGQFVAQYGRQGARSGPTDSEGQPTTVRNSHDPENFGRVAQIFVDAEANEAFLADGYLNKRVAVLDADSGEMKRFWGAYGNLPDDDYEFGPQGLDDQNPPQQFRNPVHCVMISNDGLVYVCDRQADRVQVFTKEGTFVQEAFYAPKTLRSGSTWGLTFSGDPEQRYLFIVDGVNEKVRIVLRETLEELTNFGAGGRQPGQFFGVHSIDTDSSGNIYTTETYEGKRLQKFVYMGMGPVPSSSQGVLWPSAQ